MQFVRQLNWFIERIVLNSSIGNKEKQYAIYEMQWSKKWDIMLFPPNEKTLMNLFCDFSVSYSYIFIKYSNTIITVPSQVTVKWKIIFHFNAYFMSCISRSVSTSLLSELCCVGMFLTNSAEKRVKDVWMLTNRYRSTENVSISHFLP